MAHDFSGQNLRGRSFKGRKDLSGANFSYADIRGADFTKAILKGANFSHVQAGRQHHWAIVLLAVSLFLSTLSGFVSAFAGDTTGAALISENPIEILTGLVILITLAVFFLLTIRQSLLVAFGVVATVVVAAAAAEVAGVAVAGAVVAAVGAGAMAMALAVVAAVAASGAGAGAGAVAVVAAAAAAAAGLAVPLAASGAVAGAVAAAVAVAVAMSVAGLSTSVSRQALAGDRKYTFIRTIAIAFAATGGTSFRSADLTDADFTQAILESTNFTEANLTCTCWFQAKKLDFARVGKTYLETPQVRQLLITKEGQNQNFDNLPLRGVNLRRANLVDASFIGADLSEANLQSANLLKAKLKQTQLDRTDLTGAYLTGAYIEDWGITSETKIDAEVREYLLRRAAKKRRLRPEASSQN
jgi:uncharacterized protein YjbI with pentapeptide repeats